MAQGWSGGRSGGARPTTGGLGMARLVPRTRIVSLACYEMNTTRPYGHIYLNPVRNAVNALYYYCDRAEHTYIYIL